MKIKVKYFYALIASVFLIFVLSYFAYPYLTGRSIFPNTNSNTNTDGNNDINSDNGEEDKVTRLAKCLSDKGAVMFGSAYCGHCSNQKKMFGDAFKYIEYVECTEETEKCQQNNIQSVPAWKINGILYVGSRPLDSLASLVGCPF